MRFELNKKYYGDAMMYNKSIVYIYPGLTVLVGCNGIGKTTLITQLKERCNEFNIPYLDFNQVGMQSSSMMMDRMLNLDNDISGLTSMYCQSEGKKIKETFCYFGKKYMKFMNEIKSEQERIFFFFDAVDSGFSVDNVLEFKYDCVNSIIETCKNINKEAYIIVSCNEYEMARNENCIILPELNYRQIKSYNTYRKIILRSRRKLNRIHGYEEFIYE